MYVKIHRKNTTLWTLPQENTQWFCTFQENWPKFNHHTYWVACLEILHGVPEELAWIRRRQMRQRDQQWLKRNISEDDSQEEIDGDHKRGGGGKEDQEEVDEIVREENGIPTNHQISWSNRLASSGLGDTKRFGWDSLGQVGFGPRRDLSNV